MLGNKNLFQVRVGVFYVAPPDVEVAVSLLVKNISTSPGTSIILTISCLLH